MKKCFILIVALISLDIKSNDVNYVNKDNIDKIAKDLSTEIAKKAKLKLIGKIALTLPSIVQASTLLKGMAPMVCDLAGSLKYGVTNSFVFMKNLFTSNNAAIIPPDPAAPVLPVAPDINIDLINKLKRDIETLKLWLAESDDRVAELNNPNIKSTILKLLLKPIPYVAGFAYLGLIGVTGKYGIEALDKFCAPCDFIWLIIHKSQMIPVVQSFDLILNHEQFSLEYAIVLYKHFISQIELFLAFAKIYIHALGIKDNISLVNILNHLSETLINKTNNLVDILNQNDSVQPQIIKDGINDIFLNIKSLVLATINDAEKIEQIKETLKYLNI